jgi:hypothetical protein
MLPYAVHQEEEELARCVTQVDGKLVMMSMRLPHTTTPGR